MDKKVDNTEINEKVLYLLKDIVNSNENINKEEYMSLNELLNSIRNSKSNNIKKFSNKLNIIKKFYNAENVFIYINKENKNRFRINIYTKLYKYYYDFEYKNNDLLLLDTSGKNDILQKIGKEILDLYKSYIWIDRTIRELKIENNYLEIFYSTGEIDILNIDCLRLYTTDYECENKIVLKILDYLLIYFDLENVKDPIIKCKSLNINNFINENLSIILNNIFIEKSKCPEEILNEYEKLKKSENETNDDIIVCDEIKCENKSLLKKIIKKLKK